MNSKPLISALLILLFVFFCGSCKSDLKENLMTDDAILHLITQMTLEEKISMVHGWLYLQNPNCVKVCIA